MRSCLGPLARPAALSRTPAREQSAADDQQECAEPRDGPDGGERCDLRARHIGHSAEDRVRGLLLAEELVELFLGEDLLALIGDLDGLAVNDDEDVLVFSWKKTQ